MLALSIPPLGERHALYCGKMVNHSAGAVTAVDWSFISSLGLSVTVVVLSFDSFVLSVHRMLQRATLTSSLLVRYEQVFDVDGLEIWLVDFAKLLAFCELLLAHRDGLLVTLLKTKTPMVRQAQALVRYPLIPHCCTTLGVQRDLVKSISTLYQSLHRHLA